MKIRLVAAALASLTLMAGMTGAAPPAGPDDSTLTIDLTPIDGSIYFLMCETLSGVATTAAAECRGVSIWEDANIVPGLQSRPYLVSRSMQPADTLILG